MRLNCPPLLFFLFLLLLVLLPETCFTNNPVGSSLKYCTDEKGNYCKVDWNLNNSKFRHRYIYPKGYTTTRYMFLNHTLLLLYLYVQ